MANNYSESEKNQTTKKKDIRNGLCVFLSIVLVVELLVAGLKYPGFWREKGGDITKNNGEKISDELTWEKVNSESAVMPSTGGSVTLCGVTVASSADNLNKDETVEVVDYGTQTSNGEEIHQYDISIGKHRQFETPVAITYPISKADDEDVAVVHYDEDKDKWIPLATEYDEESKTVTAYFSSLSPSKVTKEKSNLHSQLFYTKYDVNENGEKSSQNATMEVSRYYWSILKRLNSEKLSAEALKFAPDPALYAEDFKKYSDSYLRDRSAAIEENNITWAIAGPSMDICNQLMQNTYGFRYTDLDYSDEFGNALGWVTLIMATVQAYDDFDKAGGDWNAVQAPAKNVYTNIFSNSGTIYSLATGYSSIGFTLSFAGVSLVAFGLDKSIEWAEGEMQKRTADVFNAYFESVAPFDKNEWYQIFREAYYQSGNDPDAASKVISDKIDSTVEGFWTDIYNEENIDVLIAATEADTKNIFTKDNIYFYDVTPEEKEMLNSQMKRTIWKKFKKEAMPLVNRFLTERMQESVLENLSKFTEPFNNYLEFEIMETVPDIEYNAESVAECAGCTLAFGNSDGIIKDWDPIRISEDMTDGWMTNYSCTIMGYAEGGCPDRIYVYESDEAMRKGDKPITYKKFDVSFDGVTKIDFTKSDEESEEMQVVNNGTFPSVDTEMKIISATDSTYNYVEYKDASRCYEGKPARFTLNSDGSFKVVIPSLTGYSEENWQINSHSEAVITGIFDEATMESVQKNIYHNGAQSDSKEAVKRVSCDTPKFETTNTEIATTVYLGDSPIVTTDKYVFSYAEPQYGLTYLFMYVTKDGTVNIEISLEGTEENSWTSKGDDYNESGDDKSHRTDAYMLEGTFNLSDTSFFWDE